VALELELAPAWILSDGAAGNRRPAEALAHALGIDPREFVLSTAAPWRWLAPRVLPGSASAFGADFAAALTEPPRLAIGCGRQAALATRWLRARIPNCRAVQILDPRIDCAHFDAVLAPDHDALRGPSVLSFSGGLHAIDGAALARARIAHAELSRLPGPRTLVLLGGSHAAFDLDRGLWNHLCAILRHWQARDGGSLLLSSSRRTPEWLRTAARQDLADLPGRQWHGDADGANPYAGFLAWADRIIVTPDSANMLAEACATAVPVLCPLTRPLRGKLAGLYRELLERGRVRPLKLDYSAWPVEPMRETARIADALRRLLSLPR
jgi:mitochondrial fission protein ELM1